jgi:hypothetical protein
MNKMKKSDWKKGWTLKELLECFSNIT